MAGRLVAPHVDPEPTLEDHIRHPEDALHRHLLHVVIAVAAEYSWLTREARKTKSWRSECSTGSVKSSTSSSTSTRSRWPAALHEDAAGVAASAGRTRHEQIQPHRLADAARRERPIDGSSGSGHQDGVGSAGTRAGHVRSQRGTLAGIRPDAAPCRPSAAAAPRAPGRPTGRGPTARSQAAGSSSAARGGQAHAAAPGTGGGLVAVQLHQRVRADDHERGGVALPPRARRAATAARPASWVMPCSRGASAAASWFQRCDGAHQRRRPGGAPLPLEWRPPGPAARSRTAGAGWPAASVFRSGVQRRRRAARPAACWGTSAFSTVREVHQSALLAGAQDQPHVGVPAPARWTAVAAPSGRGTVVVSHGPPGGRVSRTRVAPSGTSP